MTLLVTEIGQLVTNDESRKGLLGIVEDAAVAIEGGTIVWAGRAEEIPDEYRSFGVHPALGAAVVPGFVDSHTHAVFAGDRSHEFAARLRGATYVELQASGGGIYSTVRSTRDASLDELAAASLPRIARMLAQGTTTIEIKTGYGLDVATEVKMLDAIDQICNVVPIDAVPTFLGAHVVAPRVPRRQGLLCRPCRRGDA